MKSSITENKTKKSNKNQTSFQVIYDSKKIDAPKFQSIDII